MSIQTDAIDAYYARQKTKSDFDAARKRLEESYEHGDPPVERDDIRLLLAEVERLRAALGNELSDDSPERHTYSTCTAGEGDQVNADRGCQRCAAWLALRGEGEK